MSEVEIRCRLDNLFDSVFKKHGDKEAGRTMFPIRFFEFGQSTLYDLYGKGHLWDMRVQCLVYPGQIEVTPCIIRLCPEPFDGSFSCNSVVSNLTGCTDRASLGRYMRAPFAMRRSHPGSVLEAVGISEERLQDILQSLCAVVRVRLEKVRHYLTRLIYTMPSLPFKSDAVRSRV